MPQDWLPTCLHSRQRPDSIQDRLFAEGDEIIARLAASIADAEALLSRTADHLARLSR